MNKRPTAVRNASNSFPKMECCIMETIVTLSTQKTPFEAAELEKCVPWLDALKIGISVQEQCSLAASLWNIYVKLIENLPKGASIDFQIILRALLVSLNNDFDEHQQLAASALSAIASVAEYVAFPFAIVCRIVNKLISGATKVSTEHRWRALTRINDALRVSSMLHEYFPLFVKSLFNDEGTIQSKELAELVASIIRTSAALLNQKNLINLQHKICSAALTTDILDINVLKILNAFLESNHEGIPVPIQVACKIYAGYFGDQDPLTRAEMSRGRILCELYIRPRRIIFECDTITNYDVSTNGLEVDEREDTIEGIREQIGEPVGSSSHNEGIERNELSAEIDMSIDLIDEVGTDEDASGQEKEDRTNLAQEIIQLDDDDDENICTAISLTDAEFNEKTVEEMLKDFVDE